MATRERYLSLVAMACPPLTTMSHYTIMNRLRLSWALLEVDYHTFPQKRATLKNMGKEPPSTRLQVTVLKHEAKASARRWGLWLIVLWLPSPNKRVPRWSSRVRYTPLFLLNANAEKVGCTEPSRTTWALACLGRATTKRSAWGSVAFASCLSTVTCSRVDGGSLPIFFKVARFCERKWGVPNPRGPPGHSLVWGGQPQNDQPKAPAPGSVLTGNTCVGR
jgi:hypothetical protein